MKQTTALNDPAPKAMLVASPFTIRTEPSSARSRAASSGSYSRTVSDGTSAASGLVLAPYPGPSSRTRGPRSTPSSARGSTVPAMKADHPGERQRRRW